MQIILFEHIMKQFSISSDLKIENLFTLDHYAQIKELEPGYQDLERERENKHNLKKVCCYIFVLTVLHVKFRVMGQDLSVSPPNHEAYDTPLDVIKTDKI